MKGTKTIIRGHGGTVGARRALKFEAGDNVTIAFTDSEPDQEIEVKISASGGGSAVPTGRSGAWPLAGLSLGSTYEDDGGYVQLARRLTFPIARSIALADSEYGYTWRNRANLTSGDENTTTAGARVMNASASSTDWWPSSGRTSNPFPARLLKPSPGRCARIVARLDTNAGIAYKGALIAIVSNTSDSNYMAVGLVYNGGLKASSKYGSSSTYSGVVAGPIWVSIEITQMGGSAFLRSSYSTSASTTPPNAASMTTLHTATVAADPSGWWVGQMSQTYPNTDANCRGTWHYMDVDGFEDGAWEGAGLTWGAAQFDATSATQWCGYVDLGSDSPSISLAALRLDLASRENLRDGDTATVEWSLVRDAGTGSPGAGSWYSAAALAESGSGRYLHLYCRITSTGDDQGSVWWGNPPTVRAA